MKKSAPKTGRKKAERRKPEPTNREILLSMNETLGTMSKTLVRIEKRLGSTDENIEVLTHNSYDMGNTLRSVNGNLHSLNRNVQGYTSGAARALDDEFARGKSNLTVLRLKNREVIISPPSGGGCESPRPASSGKG